MIASKKKIRKNQVVNRFLPIPETVLKGLEPEPKITDFTLIRELGIGSFGRVLLVQHNVTQAQYAIKAIDKRIKDNIDEKPYFRREMEIMYQIHHPNVVKLFGHFEDNTYCYFIMEYLPNGNLYSLVPKHKKQKISTQTAASLIKDVISALYYLHHMNPPIIHRDIKPENILIDEQMRAKLSDFGWSNYLRGNYKRTTICGTPIYLAPEIINDFGHDEKIDIWCVGVLMFELLTGHAPWEGDDVTTVKRNISQMKIKWPKKMDPDARDIISKILRYMPEERPTWRTIINHKFFKKFYPYAEYCLQRPNNSGHKLYLISKDHPLTYNNLLYNTFTNNPSFKEVNPTPSLPLYTSVLPSNTPNYSSLKYSLIPQSQIDNIETRATIYTVTPINSSNFPKSDLKDSITNNEEYIIPPIINSITPNHYTQTKNIFSIPSLYNNEFPYNSLKETTYSVSKINNSIITPISTTPIEYNISKTNGYSEKTINSLSYDERIENEKRINELVRKTQLNTRNKNYSIDTEYNFNINGSSRPIVYQTQYRTQKPIYYSSSSKNLNTFSFLDNNLYSSLTNDTYKFSLSNNRYSILNDSFNNYHSFKVLNDPEILKWKEQERLRRESERIKLSSFMNKYGMDLTSNIKNKYNYI